MKTLFTIVLTLAVYLYMQAYGAAEYWTEGKR